MKENGKICLLAGIVLLLLFGIWTNLIQTIDVQPVGVNGSDISIRKIRFELFYNPTIMKSDFRLVGGVAWRK